MKTKLNSSCPDLSVDILEELKKDRRSAKDANKRQTLKKADRTSRPKMPMKSLNSSCPNLNFDYDDGEEHPSTTSTGRGLMRSSTGSSTNLKQWKENLDRREALKRHRSAALLYSTRGEGTPPSNQRAVRRPPSRSSSNPNLLAGSQASGGGTPKSQTTLRSIRRPYSRSSSNPNLLADSQTSGPQSITDRRAIRKSPVRTSSNPNLTRANNSSNPQAKEQQPMTQAPSSKGLSPKPTLPSSTSTSSLLRKLAVPAVPPSNNKKNADWGNAKHKSNKLQSIANDFLQSTISTSTSTSTKSRPRVHRSMSYHKKTVRSIADTHPEPNMDPTDSTMDLSSEEYNMITPAPMIKPRSMGALNMLGRKKKTSFSSIGLAKMKASLVSGGTGTPTTKMSRSSSRTRLGSSKSPSRGTSTG